jgi:Predicted periplasmic lipoprotein (DUF2279)
LKAKIRLAVCFVFFVPAMGFCQSEKTLSLEPADSVHKARARLVSGIALGLYPVSMYWLYSEWYADYPQTTFHTFNDGDEWLQADKVGHLWTAYNIAKPLARSFEWAGIGKKKSALYGAGISWLYLTTVEVFDGFSEQWGFSWPDMACNTVGAGAFAAQELAWGHQKFVLKYSFHQTDYADYRPKVLGENLPEHFLKDYNGWTYWLCVNPSVISGGKSFLPPWLGLAAGYGVDGLIGGHENPTVVDGITVPDFNRQRQYYLSLDLDLSRVRWKSKFFTSFFKLINIIKLPAPALEFNSDGPTKFYLFYF